MQILKYTKLNDNTYNVLIDNHEIRLYDDVIVKYELLRSKEISDEFYEEIIKYNSQLDAYYKALIYITKKMRNKKEIEKFLSKEYSKDIIDKTIDKLYKDGYLNDKLYIECFIRDQINLTHNGPLKILNSLKELDFNKENILSGLELIEEDIFKEKLEKLINKKIKLNYKYSENKIKEKILIDLNNLGYDKTMIIDLLNNVEIKTPDNLLEKEYKKIYMKLAKKYSGEELKYKVKTKLISKGFKYDEIAEIRIEN